MKAALAFFFGFEEDDLGIGLRLTPSHRGINVNFASIFRVQVAFALLIGSSTDRFCMKTGPAWGAAKDHAPHSSKLLEQNNT